MRGQDPGIEQALRGALLAGKHLLNALRSVDVQPDEIRSLEEAERQVWPSRWAFDAWCARHHCRTILHEAGWDTAPITRDRRSAWRTRGLYEPDMDRPVGEPAGGRILVVDDVTNVRRVCRITLEAAGFEVTEAEDGEEALALAADLRPALLLLDLGLPLMSGWDVLEELKRHPTVYGEVAIVLLTVEADLDAKLRALTEQADGYVSKPFEPDELVRIVGTVLEGRVRSPMLERHLPQERSSTT